MWVTALADTHVRQGRNQRLPEPVYDTLARSDAVLHAGDVLSRELLAELASFAPVYAVLGNNDHELIGVLPETRRVTLARVDLALVHDPGARAGRAARLSRRFLDGGSGRVRPHARTVCTDGSRRPAALQPRLADAAEASAVPYLR